MKALETTLEEMLNITSEIRIRTALRSRLPPSTRYDVLPGDSVMIFREGSKKWECPFIVTKVNEKEVWVTDGQKEKQFSRTIIFPDPSKAADKKLPRVSHGFRKFHSGHVPGVILTEVIHPTDQRTKDEVFDQARARKISVLF